MAPVPGQPPMAPVPGQPPMYPGQPQPMPPYQAMPYGQQPSGVGGNPVGAVLLGFLVSFVVSLLYTGLILGTYKDQSVTTANTLYLLHALVNGALVGCLVGRMAPHSNGARIGGAVVAALGALFGYTNAVPLVGAVEQSPTFVGDLLRAEPFYPVKAWWHSGADGGIDWFSPLGLVLAAVAAAGLAHVIGNRRRPA
ncbi:hypothetical protein [Streptomyces cylindrosporus]|uniref:Integral membrane protein n=1 Tax=Streptomyces cylindrosporus TaxID=2927583 RepID=A0ABS9YL12_9ACTN|nr:hypothetical protein [Streptomyces cylindrosporus]MCI3277908.1 hypothetical protein [Streptomyces cylindrosporus]